MSAVARTVTSARARLRPLAPVGGTMWAASPARNSRRYRMGEATKLRIGVMAFSVIEPTPSHAPVGGPPVIIVGGRPLQVQPADLRGPHGVEREAALVPGVDQ